jgi:proteasome accessory factor B
VFDRDPNFDPVRFTELGFGALHGPAFEIVIEFDASVAHLARERRWHATQQIEAMSDGRVRLTMTAAGLPEVAAWIASFGGKVTAVAPEGLIGAVRALHEGGIAACGQGGRGD